MFGFIVYTVLTLIFIVFAVVEFVDQGYQTVGYSALAMVCLAMARTYILESDRRGE